MRPETPIPFVNWSPREQGAWPVIHLNAMTASQKYNIPLIGTQNTTCKFFQCERYMVKFPISCIFKFLTFCISCRRTNPNPNSDIQPPSSRLGPRNVTARSTFHSGQTRPRTQNGPDRSTDPTGPGARPSLLSKLTSRFSKR